VTGSRARRSAAIRRLSFSLTVFWIYFYVSSSSLRGTAGGSGTISVTGNTLDTYRSVLFTAQSSLRDVGVPISVASAVILPLARRTAFTNSRGPARTLCEPLPSFYPIPLRSGSASLLSCYVIVKNSPLPSFFRPCAEYERGEERRIRAKRMIQFRFSSVQFRAHARADFLDP